MEGSCTASDPLGLPAPLSGPEFQQLRNGDRLASPSHCSPAGHKDKDTQNHDIIKQQKQAQIQLLTHNCFYRDVNIKKSTHLR